MEFTQEQKLFNQVIKEAWGNPEFKNELKANPISAIEKLTGIKLNLPEGKSLVVRDQTDNSVIYVNIPTVKKVDDVELNEEQLEAVAGGTSWPPEGNSTVYNPFEDILKPSPTFPIPNEPTINL